MARTGIVVSRATSEDEPRLVPLWIEARTASGQSPDWAQRAAREGRVRQALDRTDVRVFLAESGEEAIGFVAVTTAPLSGLGDDTAVWVDQLFVVPSHRRKGVAQALLGAVAVYADVSSVQQVTSCVPSGAKDINRYFARLGFAAQTTVRTIPTRALQRRLGGHGSQPDQVLVRRRRSLRERARHGLRGTPEPELEPGN